MGTDLAGRQLAHYEILEVAGSGGMGVVYKARDSRLNRTVALKVLAPEHVADPERKRRFINEARAVSALNHPNIVTIYDIASQDGMDFLAMEFVSGATLHDRLQEGPLPLKVSLDYACQIADAIAASHAAGIVHRDLKPRNIMITVSDRIKVLDFGLAKLQQSSDAGEEARTETALTTPGLIIGTVNYMSPEQGRGENVDHRTDIFSFGAILYAMLAGRPAFAGQHSLATLHAIQFDNPPSLSTVRPETGIALEAILNRALEKDRAKRYQSADEMLADLRAESSSHDYSKTAEPRRVSFPKRRTQYALLSGAAASVAVLVAWNWPDGSTGIRSRNETKQATVAAQPRTPFDFLSSGRELLYRHDRPGSVDKAAELFERAIALDESYAPAYAGLAMASVRQYNRDMELPKAQRALALARKSVVLDPQLSHARVALAWALMINGKNAEAEQELRYAAKLDPQSGDLYRASSELASRSEDRPTGEKAIRKAIELNPGHWEYRLALGSLLAWDARYGEAESALLESIRLAPDSVVAHRNLATVYHKTGEFPKAAAHLQKCIEISPSPTIYSNLGTLYFFQGLYREAASALEKAIKLNPNDYLIWNNMGDAYRMMPGNEDKANLAYTRAVQIAQERLATTPKDFLIRSRLAVYLAKAGSKQPALTELTAIEALPAKDANLLFRLVLAYELVGERNKALKHLGSALRAGYSLTEVQREPYLTSLRKDPQYHLLLAKRGL